jgi:uncharacterized protein YdhG (YjbR/CyaY superfamily)
MRMASEVDQWFGHYENPHKELMLEIRAFMLAADSKLEECIKWQAPTFTYKGNLATFNPRSKKHVSLMFHTGAKIPGEFPDLTKSGETAAFMTFADRVDFERKKTCLANLVKAWVTFRDGDLAE